MSTVTISSSNFGRELNVDIDDRITPIENELESLKKDVELHKKILRKQNWCNSIKTKRGKRR